MYESQKIEIKQARQDIEDLTIKSQNAYQQITDMIDEVLFIVNAIYRMDISILKQFVSIQSFLFYLFWCILSYITTFPISVKKSRVFLFSFIIICIVLERFLINSLNDIIGHEYDVAVITEWCILLRKILFTSSVAIYMWFFFYI